ncbi:hypothetical protein [Deinococcus sp. QL22]|uniref:hypothetical protein n=1 Tax=Deinococcus sp. QL22 TaxID=2939437 RepID=UPI002017AE42|nr:hypothetical protein [Deinococcus sp. QL22]UQN10150.1 hypothetical protein M1R55_28605 [Deinococcus sp. QL22]
MKRHPVQQAFVAAEARVSALNDEVQRLAVPFHLQVEAGEITEDAWCDCLAELEASTGWDAAIAEREVTRQALIAWGLEQVQALWPKYGRLFPGETLDTLEALFAHKATWRRLSAVIVRLDPVAA